MSLIIEKGVITSPGATGVVAYSLGAAFAGVTPKAILMWTTYRSAEGGLDGDLLQSIGQATDRGGTPVQWVGTATCDDNVGTTVNGSSKGANGIIREIDNPTSTTVAVVGEADFDSFAAQEFSLNWVDLPTVASSKVHYIVWGGTDISDALCGTIAVSATPGLLAETVVAGFGKPEAMLFSDAAVNAPSDFSGNARTMFSFCVSDTERFCSIWRHTDGAANVQWNFWQKARALLDTTSTSGDPAVQMEADLTAKADWPTDGFELNVTAGPTGTRTIGYIAFRWTALVTIGQATVPTAAAPVVSTLTGPATGTPKLLLVFHGNIISQTTQEGDDADLGYWGIGAYDGTNEGHCGVGDDDANTTSTCWRTHSESKVIQMYTPAASGTLTSEGDAGFSGHDATITFGDTDSVARAYCYVIVNELQQNLAPGGIATSVALGSHTVTRGAVNISVPSIGSSVVLGGHTVLPGAVNIAPGGIPSGAALGTPSVTQSSTILPPGIPSSVALGTPEISQSAVLAEDLAYGVDKLKGQADKDVLHR